MKKLIKNCKILATGEDEHFKVLEDSVLLVDGDTIAYIGSEDACPKADETIDLDGAVLMPGLVNAHGHGPMTLVRAVGGGLPLDRWLNEAIFPLEDKMKPEHILAGENWAMLEMLASGTTLVAEMYDFPWKTGEALVKGGMKGTICRVGLRFNEEPEIPTNRFAECVELVRDWKDPRGRVTADFCLHSEYLTLESFAAAVAEANKTYHVGVHVHVSETAKEHEECKQRHGGLTPVAYLNKMGILDENTYMAHCVYVEDEDMDIMKEKGCTAVFNPTSNSYLGSGMARIDRLKAVGVNVALGTDGVASNNNLNMFEEMHISSLLRKNYAHDPTVAGAEETLKMATINGAKALGRFDTGEIKVGKKADLTAVSLDKPHMYPAFDIINLLVYSAQASDVTMTMVDGDILYRNGEYFTIDKEKAKPDLEKAIKEIMA